MTWLVGIQQSDKSLFQSWEKVQTKKIIPSLQLQFLHHHLYGHLFLPNHCYQTLYLRIIRMHLVLSLS